MSKNTYQVRWAIYGAVNNSALNQSQTNASNKSQANDVTVALQQLLDAGTTVLLIGNGPVPNPPTGYSYFADPYSEATKAFAALVNVNGVDQYFACSEYGTIDFALTPLNAQN